MKIIQELLEDFPDMMYSLEYKDFQKNKNRYTASELITRTIDENVDRIVLKKDGVVIEYESGERIAEDGSYEITFSNYDGYVKMYTFIIDAIAPAVTLDGASNGEYVNNVVKAYFAEDETAEIFKNGELLGEYKSGTGIIEDGSYRLVVKDVANNETVVKFTIDTKVEWSVNIYNQGLANNVIVTADEEVEFVLLKDGVAVKYTLGDTLAEKGEYSLEITDMLGNTEKIVFLILEPFVREFVHDFDGIIGLDKVIVNEKEKVLDQGILELKEDGECS